MLPSQHLPVWDIPLSRLPLLPVPLKPRRLSREHHASEVLLSASSAANCIPHTHRADLPARHAGSEPATAASVPPVTPPPGHGSTGHAGALLAQPQRGPALGETAETLTLGTPSTGSVSRRRSHPPASPRGSAGVTSHTGQRQADPDGSGSSSCAHHSEFKQGHQHTPAGTKNRSLKQRGTL